MKEEAGSNGEKGERGRESELLYTVSEIPPWHQCLLLGFQQFLTAFASTLSFPFILGPHLCISGDTVGLSEHIGTVIFVSGISTLIQSLIGVRLPIVQSASFAFITPIITLMSLPHWKCPYTDITANKTLLPEHGSAEHKVLWHARLAEVSGAIMLSSIFQVVVGFSGLMSLLLRMIGPLTIAPTITMLNLNLFDVAYEKAGTQWWIALATLGLIALFSQYLRKFNVPCCTLSKKGLTKSKMPVFVLFPVLLAVGISWTICVILTVTNTLPDDKTKWGYRARTDILADVLEKAEWFRFPYPGQWGMPTFSVAGVFGMLAANMASMVESVGDYYACARLSGAPPPPGSAISRGIGVEGITCILAGAWGSGGGTTSYGDNIGAIGITKVGSRRVIQVGALMMILLGCLGKFCAFFVTIPDPVVGGMFFVMFGMVAAVGISNLQFVDLGSSRNLFVLGVAMFSGLCIPRWIAANPGQIHTGSEMADQILTVLCGTSMFMAGAVAAFLDNTIPGTDEERGILKWRQHDALDDGKHDTMATYDLPYVQSYFNKMTCTKYVPFCPTFVLDNANSTQTESYSVVENDKIVNSTEIM